MSEETSRLLLIYVCVLASMVAFGMMVLGIAAVIAS